MAESQYENKDKKLHISHGERDKWDKVVVDFGNHLGAGGVSNHALGDGEVPGFSTNDFTNDLKNKLDGIQDNALNNPYPGHIPHSDVEGLSKVGSTGKYGDLLEIPETFTAGGGNSDTVGGIRLTINNVAPSDPKNNKELWIDTSQRLIMIYTNSQWVAMCAVYA